MLYSLGQEMSHPGCAIYEMASIILEPLAAAASAAMLAVLRVARLGIAGSTRSRPGQCGLAKHKAQITSYSLG